MKLVLPLAVYLPRVKTNDKPFHLNLNNYRNAHHQILNQAKVIYKDEVWLAVQLAGLRPQTFKLTPPVRFVYTLYPKTRRETDVSNVLSIVDKFTADAIVDLGFLEDDNYKIVREVVYRFGMIDPEKPRAELEIDEYGRDPGTERQRQFDFAD